MKPYYEQAGVTIYLGDSAEIVPQLGGGKFDLVITDPPYAIGNTRGEWGATAEVAIGLHEAAKKIHGQGALVAFTTTSGRGIEFTQAALRRQLPFNRLLLWHRAGGKSRAVSPWRWDAVSVMVFGRSPERIVGASSVLTTAATKAKTEHPSEIPAEVAEWCYAPFDADDLGVLDPFMGSGRLLEPAVRRGRVAVGIDRDERWCELAARRFRVLTERSSQPVEGRPRATKDSDLSSSEGS